MNSINRLFRKHRNLFIALVLSSSFIIALLSAVWVYLFLPSNPSMLYICDLQSTPMEGYEELKYEEFDYIQYQNPIISKLRFGENLTFYNTTQGGPSEYIIHTYNKFKLNTEKYYLRILNRICITALFKIESYVLQNDTWTYDSTIFKWQNPRDYYIFMYSDNGISREFYGSVFDDLIINNSLIEENHEWLDLGYSEIGLFKTIQGYGIILMHLRSNSATNAYSGIEDISNNTKTIIYLKKVIFRVETFWQRYENHFYGWKTLMNKVYFLGNGRTESMYGFDNLSGINFIPHDC